MKNLTTLRKQITALLFICILLLTAVPANAQETINLRLNRNVGFSLGSYIQGTFSFRVSGPDDLARVIFYVDGEPIGEDVEAPFRQQFRTEAFSLGSHTLSATGITADGREFQSNQIRRDFVSGTDSNMTELWIILPVLAIIIGGRLISSLIVNRGKKEKGPPAIDGPFGGAICPKCSHPFAMHIWGLNVGLGKYDRCPHCGKWSLVRRAPPDVLRRASAALAEDTEGNASVTNDEDSFRQQLDDSRFD